MADIKSTLRGHRFIVAYHDGQSDETDVTTEEEGVSAVQIGGESAHVG